MEIGESISNLVRGSIRWSINDSTWYSVMSSARDSVRNPVWGSISQSINDSITRLWGSII